MSSFPYLHVDAGGLCQPLRPPHPRMGSCHDACANDAPGGGTWEDFNRRVREGYMRIRLNECHEKNNRLAFALIEARRELANIQRDC